MFKTQETKVFGSIRKVKRYGACGVIWVWLLLLWLSHQVVYRLMK